MNQTVRAILIAAGIILLVFVLWYIRVIIGYVLIASVLSIVGRPIMHFFEARKLGNRSLPSSISALLTLVVLIGIFAGIIGMFIPLVQEEASVISNIDQETFEEGLAEPMDDLGNWMESKGMLPENTSKEEFMRRSVENLLGYIKVSDVFNYFLEQIGNVLIGIASILFIAFFFLKDRSMILRVIYALTPDKNREKMQDVLRNTKKTLTRYFIGIALQITLITLLITIGLSIFDVKHAFLLGFLAGVVNVIPYLGPIIAGFFGVLIGISGNLDADFYSDTVPLLIKIVSVFSFVQLLDNFVFQPQIFSNSVNAHPLEIFLVILSAGTLAGITGMILAVPTYSLIRILAKEFYSQFTIVQTMTKGMDKESTTLGSIKKKLFK